MPTLLEQRIDELMMIAKAENPEYPDWWVRLCVESYIKNDEPELLEYGFTPKEETEKKEEQIVEEDETD